MIYYNNWFAKLVLFKGYNTIMFFGMILTKKKSLSERALRHEKIHQCQFVEVMEFFQVVFLLVLLLAFVLGGDDTLLPFCLATIIIPPFMYYIMYGVEWLISLVHHFFSKKKKDLVSANGKAYKSSSFEMEAYDNEFVKDYLTKRKAFTFIRYYGQI